MLSMLWRLPFALAFVSFAHAQSAGTVVTPSELQWVKGRVAGVERANLVGAPGKPGPAVWRAKLPANYVAQPHTFPDDRTYTVMSGTMHLGWGTQFDEAKLKALPAGSFYTAPANTPHFFSTKAEELVLQITGTEPSGIRLVNPPKK
jgi:hypothetical protein